MKDSEKKIASVQEYLQEKKCDGWLLYDFRHSNPLACQFLELPADAHLSRRFFYWIPKQGTPIKLVHNVETHVLDNTPGAMRTYSTWKQLQQQLQEILNGARTIFMEYSPNNAIPYVSKVDAGCMELVRSCGVDVQSSADILQHYTAVLDQTQREAHIRAAESLDEVVADAWTHLGEALEKGKRITEYDMQQFILQKFDDCCCITSDPPICAVNAHAANPHYSPKKGKSALIKKGDFVLLDLWGKLDHLKGIYGDICQVAVAAEKPTDMQKKIFDIVKEAQGAALQLIRERFAANKPIQGWEVDKAARDVIEAAGYGDYFIHRTGHNIGAETHGDGAHMDNYETYDYREILPSTCFSVEPGIYLSGEFGVRLECDVLIQPDGTVEVTGGLQDEIICLLK